MVWLWLKVSMTNMINKNLPILVHVHLLHQSSANLVFLESLSLTGEKFWTDRESKIWLYQKNLFRPTLFLMLREEVEQMPCHLAILQLWQFNFLVKKSMFARTGSTFNTCLTSSPLIHPLPSRSKTLQEKASDQGKCSQFKILGSKQESHPEILLYLNICSNFCSFDPSLMT